MLHDHVDHRLVGIFYRYIEWCNVSWVIVEGSDVGDINDILLVCDKVA